MSQIVEKVQKGEGVRAKIKKVYIANVDSLWLRGGFWIFLIISQIQITEIGHFYDICDLYWWDICNISYIYGLYMNKIVLSLIWFRYSSSKGLRRCNVSFGGDQENYGLFQQFGTFLVWNAPLRVSVEGGGVKKVVDFFKKFCFVMFPLVTNSTLDLKLSKPNVTQLNSKQL